MTDFFHEYLQILTDGPHAAVELTFTIVVDGVLLGLVWPAVRKAIKREHLRVDQEHGVEHRELTDQTTDDSHTPS